MSDEVTNSSLPVDAGLDCGWHHILPVRYAVTSMSPENAPFGTQLPKHANFSTEKFPKLAKHHYTLRALRPGYVHLLDATTEKHASFKVTETNDFVVEGNDPGELRAKIHPAGWLCVHTSHPSVYVAFSEGLWTPSTWERIIKKPLERMQLFDLTKPEQPDAGAAALLPELVEEFRPEPGCLYSLRGFESMRDLFETEEDYYTPNPLSAAGIKAENEIHARWEESAHAFIWRYNKENPLHEAMQKACPKSTPLLLALHDPVGTVQESAAIHAAALETLAFRQLWYEYPLSVGALAEQSAAAYSFLNQSLEGYYRYSEMPFAYAAGSEGLGLVDVATAEKALFERFEEKCKEEDSRIAKELLPLRAEWESWLTLPAAEKTLSYCNVLQELDVPDDPKVPELLQKREVAVAKCHNSMGGHGGEETLAKLYAPPAPQPAKSGPGLLTVQEIFWHCLYGKGTCDQLKGDVLGIDDAAAELVTDAAPLLEFLGKDEGGSYYQAMENIAQRVKVDAPKVDTKRALDPTETGVLLNLMFLEQMQSILVDGMNDAAASGAAPTGTATQRKLEPLERNGDWANWGGLSLDSRDSDPVAGIYLRAKRLEGQPALRRVFYAEIIKKGGPVATVLKILKTAHTRVCLASALVEALRASKEDGVAATTLSTWLGVIGAGMHLGSVQKRLRRLCWQLLTRATGKTSVRLLPISARGLAGAVGGAPTAVARIVDCYDALQKKDMFALEAGIVGLGGALLLMCAGWPCLILGTVFTAAFFARASYLKAAGPEKAWVEKCLWGLQYTEALKEGSLVQPARIAAGSGRWEERDNILAQGGGNDQAKKEPGRSYRKAPPAHAPYHYGIPRSTDFFFPHFSYKKRLTEVDPMVNAELSQTISDHIDASVKPFVCVKNAVDFMYVAVFVPRYVPLKTRVTFSIHGWRSEVRTFALSEQTFFRTEQEKNMGWQGIILYEGQGTSESGYVWEMALSRSAICDKILPPDIKKHWEPTAEVGIGVSCKVHVATGGKGIDAVPQDNSPALTQLLRPMFGPDEPGGTELDKYAYASCTSAPAELPEELARRVGMVREELKRRKTKELPAPE